MKKRSTAYLVEQACRVEEVSAIDDLSLGYAHPIMSKFAPFPARKIPSNEFNRTNGNKTLSLVSPSDIGLPYGACSRIILSRITTIAKQSKTRDIYLGSSMNQFVRSLEKIGSGGGTGGLKYFKDHCRRLFACSILVSEVSESSWDMERTSISNRAFISWELGKVSWQSSLRLTQKFYSEIQEKAFPIDMRVMYALSHYPMAIDVYCWLTHRAFSLNARVFVRWDELVNQFGNTYSRDSNFKSKFKKAIKTVMLFYSNINLRIIKEGLVLFPFKPHIPKLHLVDSEAG